MLWRSSKSQLSSSARPPTTVDTPGLARPRSVLNRHMMQAVREAYQHVDLILLVTDVGGPEQIANDEFILQQLQDVKTSIFLVINKIDRLDHRQILPVIEAYQQRFPFAEYVPISALNGVNLEELMQTIVKYLSEGPRYFPTDQVT